ncbi:DUF2514 family protein [Salmonella enterica]|uniref:DUF2514 family protein n=1 Tax=Salmonella enterica TaxID=28901 RepID=UPI0009ACD050|nr:DUF2514 family protein [Salmonella enterica]EDS2492401.1 DUF2514 family protein [Salmonella enterica subsp. enterica serovar Javiana]EEE1035663.1 DUF2514 family protein [Salmonella enterica subsp. enterica serovar Miami]EAM7985688.1 DUF2514 family protein [Salmonella enterica]EBB2051186.1 DUF2514 family protein [Salmonella enterica]EBE4177525.1 DUF2514 family protein [Salmonella enterica]
MKTRYTLLTGFLVASVLCGTGYVIHQQVYDAGKQAERKDWQFEWSKRDEADRTAQLKQEKEQRNEELRRQKETQEIINHAEQEKQKALADAITANDAADRLRRKIASIRRELAASETSRVSADVARRQTAAETANLFADLYEESDRRAGEIARYADAAASAGRVCERTYEAVTRSVE